MSWLVVYEKAIRDDGSLFFPKKLTAAFLESARRVMGSYIFANQYQNEIIPADELVFRPEWIRYYKQIPENVRTFIHIDPAISLEKSADYTAVAVVHVDSDNTWYVPFVRRYRISPTGIVDLVFKLNAEFKPMTISIEEIAFQKALLYMIDEKQKDLGKLVPVIGIKPGNDESKENRILGLIPRFEWGKIFFAQGLLELEDEMAKFPRARHDDCLDALSMVERISVPPGKERITDDQPNPADAANYERWYRGQLAKKSHQAQREAPDFGTDTEGDADS